MTKRATRLWLGAAAGAAAAGALPLLLFLTAVPLPVQALPPPPQQSPPQFEGQKHQHCPNCLHPTNEHEQIALDNLRIEGIKQQILSKLGLRAKPNITSNIPRELLLQTLYRSEEDRKLLEQVPSDAFGSEDELVEDDYYAKTSEIISFAEPGPQVNNHTLLEFIHSHEEDVGSLRVTEASLWIYVRRRPGHHRRGPLRALRSPRTTIIWVFRVQEESAHDQYPTTKLVTSLPLTEMHLGWRQLNATQAVQRWFGRPDERLQLLVDCSSCGDELEVVLFTSRKHKGAHKPGSRRTESSHRPFLVVRTVPAPSRRLSRRALSCDKTTRQCCKQRLYISFHKLGWEDWIIAPRGYFANYCKGNCASVYRTLDSFSNFYSHVLEEFRRYQSPGALEPCCAPTKLSPMSLIYLDEYSNIIKRDVPRMVVDECGCA
ncbi:inhibin beta B chain-like [Oratosquilla oratoria]|uniref:inhibin beta B chain-like n=1 Tax=Oratosquilla oratoria TaxID=337810 RepID=UPI003F76FBFA